MKKMKKILSIITSIALSAVLFVMPLSAAEITPVEGADIITASSDAMGYWSKTTAKLTSMNGEKSNVATVSFGSINGAELQITSAGALCNVILGSDPFYLYIEDVNENIYCTTVSKSGTITIPVFNGVDGLDPYGSWKIWIVTKGTISIVTITLTVYYTY